MRVKIYGGSVLSRQRHNEYHLERNFFQSINKNTGSLTTIAGSDTCIIGSGKSKIILPMGTTLVIEEAFLYLESTRTLLNFKDIRANGLHVKTEKEYGKEYLLIIKHEEYRKRVLE